MIKAWLRKWLGVDAQQAGTVAPEAVVTEQKKAMQITQSALDGARVIEEIAYEVKMPVLPEGVVPASGMAMDSAGQSMCLYANANGFSGMGFMGYPELSHFAVISEYRGPVETLAAEMTREWIKVKSSSEDDVSEKIKIIEAQLKRHKIRELFKEAAEKDGLFGRAQIYINIKNGKEELPLVMSPATIKKGDLAGFKLIEPMWTSPAQYDSSNPTDPHFFKPTSWYVMGKNVHSGRLLTFVSRPVPDVLKPAFNFGGLSMTQLMRPYVESWHRAREAVSNLLDSFSTNGIRTNMEDVLSGGSATNVVKRAQLYNQMRKNNGLLLMDKDTEEFFQFNAPLSGVDKLQAQAQEQMAAPCHMPLVKLLGITPSGLNASSEGELVVWYDYVHSMQESLFGEHLTKVINLIQLDQFGEIDPGIEFEFVPLRQLSEVELANVRKTDADTAAALIANGVISAEEERARLAADKSSGYSSIDVENTPEIPDSERPADELDDDSEVAQDAEFDESKHPRAENGQFGSGGSAGAVKSKTLLRDQIENEPSRQKKREMVRGLAEGFAHKMESLGFSAIVEHSGSRAGASSYVTLSDPETGVRLTNQVRFSDHSKGAYNSQFVHEIMSYEDMNQIESYMLKIRAEEKARQSDPEYIKKQKQQESQAQEEAEKRRKKIENGLQKKYAKYLRDKAAGVENSQTKYLDDNPDKLKELSEKFGNTK